jgi:large subunit ribosomal protein L6
MNEINLKKFIIKIPKTVSIFFCDNNILVIKGNCCTKAIKLKTTIKIFIKKKILMITPVLLNKYKIKKLKLFYNVYIVQIKQTIKETIKKQKIKLSIIGTGYKVIVLTTTLFTPFIILQLKLGYSHFIYVKIPKDLNVVCPKPNKIFLYGYDKQKINFIGFLIKSYKMPEPYKAKGIFCFNEQIKLKKGKKL